MRATVRREPAGCFYQNLRSRFRKQKVTVTVSFFEKAACLLFWRVLGSSKFTFIEKYFRSPSVQIIRVLCKYCILYLKYKPSHFGPKKSLGGALCACAFCAKFFTTSTSPFPYMGPMQSQEGEASLSPLSPTPPPCRPTSSPNRFRKHALRVASEDSVLDVKSDATSDTFGDQRQVAFVHHSSRRAFETMWVSIIVDSGSPLDKQLLLVNG